MDNESRMITNTPGNFTLGENGIIYFHQVDKSTMDERAAATVLESKRARTYDQSLRIRNRRMISQFPNSLSLKQNIPKGISSPENSRNPIF